MHYPTGSRILELLLEGFSLRDCPEGAVIMVTSHLNTWRGLEGLPPNGSLTWLLVGGAWQLAPMVPARSRGFGGAGRKARHDAFHDLSQGHMLSHLPHSTC